MSAEAKKSRYDQLFTWGGAVGAGFVAVLDLPKLGPLLDEVASGHLEGAPALVLFFATGLYALAWFLSARREYQLFEYHFADPAPYPPLAASAGVILIPMLFGVLAYLSDHVAAYAGLFAVYALGNIVVRETMTAEAIKMISAARSADASVLAEFHRMYIEWPYPAANIFVLSCSALALEVSLWIGTGDVGLSQIAVSGNTLATVIVIVGFGLPELPLWVERTKFYKSVEAPA